MSLSELDERPVESTPPRPSRFSSFFSYASSMGQTTIQHNISVREMDALKSAIELSFFEALQDQARDASGADFASARLKALEDIPYRVFDKLEGHPLGVLAKGEGQNGKFSFSRAQLEFFLKTSTYSQMQGPSRSDSNMFGASLFVQRAANIVEHEFREFLDVNSTDVSPVYLESLREQLSQSLDMLGNAPSFDLPLQSPFGKKVAHFLDDGGHMMYDKQERAIYSEAAELAYLNGIREQGIHAGDDVSEAQLLKALDSIPANVFKVFDGRAVDRFTLSTSEERVQAFQEGVTGDYRTYLYASRIAKIVAEIPDIFGRVDSDRLSDDNIASLKMRTNMLIENYVSQGPAPEPITR